MRITHYDIPIPQCQRDIFPTRSEISNHARPKSLIDESNELVRFNDYGMQNEQKEIVVCT